MSSPHNPITPDDEALLTERELKLRREALSFIDSLPAPLKARLDTLHELQDQHYALQTEFNKELRALERKYDDLYRPLFEQRAKVVVGADDEDLPKGLPNFWLTGLKRNEVLAEMITDKDELALSHLADIRTEKLEDGISFKIEFEFTENPFFTNTVLTKTYHMADDPRVRDVMLTKSEGCTIDWKAGKNLTVKLIRKKQRHKGRGDVRTITKEEPQESFFNLFSPPEVPEEMGEEAMELEHLIEIDYEVGVILSTKIVPNAAYCYSGLSQLFDDNDDYDFEGGEEEGFEFGEDEEEDEDDEDGPPAPKLAFQAGPSAGGQPGDKPPECKQQ